MIRHTTTSRKDDNLKKEDVHMSEKQEKRKRYNQKLDYISEFEKWLKLEPCILRFVSWHKWLEKRPRFVWKDR